MYNIEKIIGNGSFSKIYKGKYNDIDVAIKKIEYSKKTINCILELIILKKIKHKNIVYSYDIIFDKYNNINIIEPLAICDLNYYIYNKKITEKNKKIIITDIIDAILYLHSLNICHCDIKPSNILLYKSNNKIISKISDFGMSRIIYDENGIELKDLPYTKYYRPIECTKNKIYLKSDIYALGLTLYEILYTKKIENKIINEISDYDLLIKNMIKDDVDYRYCITDCIKYMNLNKIININNKINNNIFYNSSISLNTKINEKIEYGKNLINENILNITNDRNCLYLTFNLFYKLNSLEYTNLEYLPTFKTCLIIVYKIFYKNIPNNISISLDDINFEIYLLKILNFNLIFD